MQSCRVVFDRLVDSARPTLLCTCDVVIDVALYSHSQLACLAEPRWLNPYAAPLRVTIARRRVHSMGCSNNR